MRRLSYLFHTLVVSAVLVSAAAAEKTQILLLAGGPSHGPGQHEFRAGCILLARALNEQSGLNVNAQVISGWPEDESVFDGVDAVIVYADGTKVIRDGWEKADQLAKSGVGLMFMHYAVHPSPEEGEKYYRPWIGGAFETGFSVNPHWVADLETLPNHPVSNGIDGKIRAYDEFYYNMRFPKDRSHVQDLATAVPTKERLKRIINLWTPEGYAGIGKKQTLMWGIERPDGGRGIGFTGGHYHHNWAIDSFRQLVLNAIVWVAGAEVPEGGVESLPITEDQLNENIDDGGKPFERLKIPNMEELMALPPNPWFTPEEHAEAEAKKRAARAKQKEKAKAK